MTIQPSGYPTTKPVLMLDFANSKQLDPRITFSRSSAATYVDATGVVKSAATGVPRFDHNQSTLESLGLLVEEQRTNSATYSEEFATKWSKYNAFILPNSITAPNGTLTGSKLAIDSNNAAHYIEFVDVSSSAPRIISVFAKPAEYSIISIGTALLATGPYISIDLLTGESKETAGNLGEWGIQSYENGWKRVWVEVLSTSTSRDNFCIGVINPSGPTYGIDDLWQGTSGGGLYIWGAQVEAGAFPTSYIPTPATFTSRASTATYYDSAGVIQTANTNVARSNAYFPDSNGVMQPAGLLLEAAGTNLLNGSQTFATSGGTQNNWVDTNITRDGTLRTSPDNTANALRVTASAADATIISSAAIGSSAQRTFSIFLRRVTGTGNIQYTLDNGTSWTTQAITTSWKRYIFPATTADQQVGIRITTSGDAIELWGAQLETYPYATSYIPTTTASVTRSADVSSSSTVTRSADVAQMTGANFSSWYTQGSGTVLAEYRTPASGTRGVVGFNDNTANERLAVYTNGTNPSFIVVDGGVTQADLDGGTVSSTSLQKSAAAFSANNFAISHNGGAVVTDTSGTVATPDRVFIGADQASNYQNGQVRRIAYYPTRLSDTTLQAITLQTS